MRKRIVITVASVLALLLNVNAITIMETTDASESTGQGVKSESLSASEFPVAAGSQKPEYASGELVIKFKSEIAEAITKAVTTGNFRVIPEAHSIGVLNSKYEVNSMERVFETSSDPKLQNIYLLNFFAEVDPMLVAYEYSQELNVEYAEPNYKVQIFALPNDTYIDPDQDGNWSEGAWGQEYEDMWGLKKIGMEKAWGIGKESKSAIVAVIDTGIDYSHEDLTPDNIWQNLKEDADGDGHTLEYTGERWILDPGDINHFDDDGNGKIDDLIGWDFYNRDNDPLDDHGHGTHCAGTIGAVTNNGVGVAGVARSVKIMALKGLSVDGDGNDDDLAKAINYAADNGADVISMSWGGLGSSIVLSDALNDAYSKGVVLVAAAGNADLDVALFCPANHEKVLAVASTNHLDEKSDFSNWGKKIAVSAPGGDDTKYDGPNKRGRNILSLRADMTDMYEDGLCIVGERYYRARGTSMACPHVSGLGALIISHFPDAKIEEIYDRIKYTTDYIEAPVPFGTGRINAYKALTKNPHPFIMLEDYRFDDKRFGNGDGAIDPGETILLTVTLKNHWRNATGVRATLKSLTPYIKVETEYAEFGDIPVGKTATNPNPYKFTVDAKCPRISTFYLELEIVTDQKTTNYAKICVKVGYPPYQKGWPKLGLGGVMEGSPVVGDVDGDGVVEIAFGTFWTSQVYLWNYKGELLNDKWPKGMTMTSATSPAMGDLDGDGDLEIVCGDMGGIFAWHHNGTPVGGWPKTFKNETLRILGIGHPTLADLNKDGFLEVIAIGKGYYTPEIGYNYLFVWDHRGGFLSGWPQKIINNFQPADAPAVGDIDGDGDLEIIAIAVGVESEVYTARIYIFHYDGKPFFPSAWPKEIPAKGGRDSIVLADLDDDGRLEIITPIKDSLYVWHWDGMAVDGWPQKTSDNIYSSPAIGDLDGGGDLEIVVSSEDNRLYAWHADGTLVKNFPVHLSDSSFTHSSPVIGDLDGDVDMEIVIGSTKSEMHIDRANIHIVHHDGREISWDIAKNVAMGSTPALADLDNDGDLEIIAAAGVPGTGGMYVWDFQGAYKPGRIDWAMFHRDKEHSGRYKIEMFLEQGWNSFSLPVLPEDSTVENIFRPVKGYYCVYYWDEIRRNYFVMDGSDMLVPGKGYLLYLQKGPQHFEITGARIQPVHKYVVSGWSFVGVRKELDRKPLRDAIYGGGIVYAFVLEKGKWRTLDKSSLLEKGEGYWLACSEEGIWDPDSQLVW